MNGLNRFAGITSDGDGARLNWHRAAIDGAPFRGPAHGPIKEDEYDDRVIRTSRFKLAFFDMSNPEHARAYATVWERYLAGWYQIKHLDRFHACADGVKRHYIEWFEFYMEDGTLAPYDPYLAPASQAVQHGTGGVAG